MGEQPREAAAAALADDADSLPGLRVQLAQALLQAVRCAARAVDVRAQPGAARRIPGALEPSGHRPERGTPGHEAGDQEDRLSVATRDALAAPDGVQLQRHTFGGEPAFTPQRGV